MADQKISALTGATTPLAGTEVLPIVQSGSTVKVSVADLTVGRSATAANFTANSTTTNAGVFADYNGTNVGRMVAAANGNLYFGQQTGSGTVSFGTSANNDIIFLNGTQIGLGTTSTTETVNFGGNAKVNTGNLIIGTTAKGITTGSAIPLGFGVNNTVTAMTIDTSSNVGIGTGAPNARFAVIPAVNPATATGTLQAVIGEASNNANYQMRMGYIFDGIYKGVINTIAAGAATDLLLNPSGGNVGIGTSAPAYQLQLSTDSAAKPSTNTWTIASDSRIKTETGEYTKGLDAVCALRPITYQYNGAAGFAVDGKENISIIAQEAMQHFPECVGTFEALLNESDEEKTKLYNWNGHALTFALVNAVKELKASNDALAARVNQLEGK